jgi:hypothetical protein
MSYRRWISDVTFEAGDLSKATFTRADEAMFEQWLVNYIATHDELSKQGLRGDIYLMFACDFTYGPDGRLVGLSAHFPWDDDYVPSFFPIELAGTSLFFRERGVRFKLVFNKAGEEDDDRSQITTTHGGVWEAYGKLVYGKRERIF